MKKIEFSLILLIPYLACVGCAAYGSSKNILDTSIFILELKML